MTLRDIDLCISLDGSDHSLLSLDELKAKCKRLNVKVRVESEEGPSGWPSFRFNGLRSDIKEVLEELYIDDDTINMLLEG